MIFKIIFKMIVYKVIIFVWCYSVTTDAARILAVFPTPSLSHQVAFRPLTEELAKRGHELVIITPNPAYKNAKAPNNIKEIDVQDEAYNIDSKKYNSIHNNTNVFSKETLQQLHEAKDDIDKTKLILMFLIERFKVEVQSKAVQELLKSNEKFDLVLAEACVPVSLIFSHIYKAPVIQISSYTASLTNMNDFGIPRHPIYYPDIFRFSFSQSNIWDKIIASYEEYKIFSWEETARIEGDKVIKDLFGPKAPKMIDLENNIDMLFANVHPIWYKNRPVPPNVIHLNGMHLRPPKKLPNDIQSFLDNSINGVIYVSFGTNVHTEMFSPEIRKLFSNVFSKLSYDILLKWNQDTFLEKPDNVRISKWLPQADILRHPKVKLFIMQGGLQSIDEAIISGVPLIGIPFLGDQFYNTEQFVKHKIGIKLDILTITEEVLGNVIMKILNDESYQTNMKRLRALILDQPQSPLERAVWWTEYVLRHGGAKHLRSPAANISWTEYLMLDVVLVLSGFALAALLVLVWLVIFIKKKLGIGKKLKTL